MEKYPNSGARAEQETHPAPQRSPGKSAIVALFGALSAIYLMVPLGALVLAQDVPFLKRPVGRAMVWLERQWLRWKRRWQKG